MPGMCFVGRMCLQTLVGRKASVEFWGILECSEPIAGRLVGLGGAFGNLVAREWLLGAQSVMIALPLLFVRQTWVNQDA
jgi:hypothetical protein